MLNKSISILTMKELEERGDQNLTQNVGTKTFLGQCYVSTSVFSNLKANHRLSVSCETRLVS